ncbi:MAG: hypothetical protein ACMXX5_01545 [Candidatus Woesearchaeota archaeon]
MNAKTRIIMAGLLALGTIKGCGLHRYHSQLSEIASTTTVGAISYVDNKVEQARQWANDYSSANYSPGLRSSSSDAISASNQSNGINDGLAEKLQLNHDESTADMNLNQGILPINGSTIDDSMQTKTELYQR